MLYRVYADTSIHFNGKEMLEIHKGIWNQEEIQIELDSSEFSNVHVVKFLNSLEEDQEAEIDECNENDVKGIVGYLTENEFIERVGFLESVGEVLKKKRILLIISEEFEEIIQIPAYKDINFKRLRDVYGEMGICSSLEDLDTYELELICKKVNEKYSKYDELAFLVFNPDISKMLVISKVMSEVDKIASYFIIDNKLFISMTYIPHESPCFNCLNLRLMARMGVLQRKRIFLGKYQHMHVYSQADKSIIELFLSLDLTMKILLEEVPCDTRGNVGSVIIWNLDTLEVTRERLYKVPFCEVC